MPPLAHYLAPQIMSKAQEFEAELGPAIGYLRVDSPPALDPNKPGSATVIGINKMQNSGDPIAQKVARAFLAGVQGKVIGKDGGVYRPPQAGRAIDGAGKAPTQPMLMPTPTTGVPIGTDENGLAVYQTAPQAQPARKGKLQLRAGAAVGIDETGESVDRKGKKLGYLAKPSAPMGDVKGLPLRDLARRPTDAPMDRRDVFGATSLQKLYTPHLKAMQDYFQDTGREEFPPGYFNGMSPAKRKEIEEGVKALREMERGTPA